MSVRLTGGWDIPLLEPIERSAAEIFRGTDRAWVADDEPTSADEHLTAIAAGLHWLALADGEPAGFLLAERFGEAVHITEIAVAASHQRHGLGGKLIAAVEQRARGIGARALTLTTYRDLPWNAPFYRRLGFAELSADSLPAHLAAKLRSEVLAGHDPQLRCAMAKPLA
jgi:GNAT superfamily N-acetyltransferase